MHSPLAFLSLLVELASAIRTASCGDRPSGHLDRPPDLLPRPHAQPRLPRRRAAPPAGLSSPLLHRCRLAAGVARANASSALSPSASSCRRPRKQPDCAASLHEHVAGVADALEPAGCGGRTAVSQIVGRDPGTPRQAGVGARGDRKPRREFFRRRRRAGFLAGGRRACRRRRLQGGQHRRQHDRPSDAAPRGVRLGVGASRRSRQSAGLAAVARC